MKVLVVSDRVTIGEIVAQRLQEARDVDVEVERATEVCGHRELLRSHRPDVVVLDLGWPERDVRRLCAELGDVGVRPVVFSAEPSEALRMLEAGATGISSARDGLDGLLDAFDTVAGGHTHVPSPLLGGVLRGLIERQREATAGASGADRLSLREREVLALLGEGCDQRAIAQRLQISPQTAKTHIRHVKHKLGVHSSLEAAAVAAELRITSEGTS